MSLEDDFQQLPCVLRCGLNVLTDGVATMFLLCYTMCSSLFSSLLFIPVQVHCLGCLRITRIQNLSRSSIYVPAYVVVYYSLLRDKAPSCVFFRGDQ
jgi:hypothetical protein